MTQLKDHPAQPELASYIRPRRPHELDLIDAVRTALLQSGLIQQTHQYYDTSEDLAYVRDKNSDVQKFTLNKYWTYQLLVVSRVYQRDTQDERFCLIPNGSDRDWLRLFTDKILPVCIEYGLPFKEA